MKKRAFLAISSLLVTGCLVLFLILFNDVGIHFYVSSLNQTSGTQNVDSNQRNHSSIWEREVYSERLKVADVDIPLLFSESVEDELKRVILADMHLILGHLSEHITYTLDEPRSFDFEIGRLNSSKTIQFRGKGRYRPTEYRNEFGAIVLADGQEHIAVSESLISAYRSAWERKTKHVEPYRELEGFVELMSEVWAGRASVNDLPQSMDELFHPVSEAAKRKLMEESGQGHENFLVANNMGEKGRWRMPSLLEIVEDTGKFSDSSPLEGAILLCPYYYFDESGYLFQAGNLIYINSTWKILIG